MSAIDENKVLEEHGLTFGDDFISDIDSWFSADIACCDVCYDDFLDHWPLASQSDFERTGIDLHSFYSGSKRCRSNYSKAEFEILLPTYKCPRCGNSLSGTIWPYELPFSHKFDSTDLEWDMYEISKIAESTPFLLLTNDFAKNTFELLNSLSKNTKTTFLTQSLYRARVASQLSDISHNQFFVAPNKFISEGRYNHAGQQTLYLASDIDTCYHEVGRTLCYVAKMKINKEVRILDLVDSENSHAEAAESLSSLVFSSLMSRSLNTEGYHKPCYVFSRFIADCARLSGFDAIKYPSTKMTSENYNIVFIKPLEFKDNISFEEIYLKDHDKNYPLKLDT